MPSRSQPTLQTPLLLVQLEELKIEALAEGHHDQDDEHDKAHS